MAAVAGSCSSGVLIRARDAGGNGAFWAQYNGLRPGENMQMVSAGTKPNGFVSTSGNVIK